MPYLWLLSLGYMLWKYLFIPPSKLELALLALTFALFVPLYLFSFWTSGRQAVLCILLTCLIGTLWAPYNLGAGGFYIYAAAMCARILPAQKPYLMLAGVLALSIVTVVVVPETHIGFLLTALIGGLSIGIASIKEADLRCSRQKLMRKQEEVEHLATIAERERISRDMHDLLGHSLSMIALKAELAGKLAGRDLEACRREIRDIETTAREALSEVRAAVTGYRQSGLANAVAGARASLAAANIELREELQGFALAPSAEHVLALGLREAVTNVVRHAGARTCSLSLALEHGFAVLRVADDGSALRSADGLRRGNGLMGMQERAASVGGALAISVAGGLALELRVPAGVAA
jgi:two-component system sensor histidine kinase DesK